MTKFSVLLSVYCKEKPSYFDIAMDSIVNQSVKPDQVILIVDGPIGDDLKRIIEKYKNVVGLEVYPLEKNMGLSYALNYGLSKCKNEIVFRMDTDDICYGSRFERTLKEYNDNPELDIVGSFATMVDEDGRKIRLMTAPIAEDDIYKKVWTCPFIHPTVSFKKSSIMRVGGYNPNSGPRQDDYELWFRCIQHKLKCKNISEPLLYYRFFKDSVARNNLKVGWWRAKVGIKGAWRCKCNPIAYIGVCYPLFRALMPSFIRSFMYKVADRFNPRTQYKND